MPTPEDADRELYRGLRALSLSAFPRQCPSCGKRFEDADAFIRQTRPAGTGSGLKAAEDDDARPLVELYRNCNCGSTLMDFFADRRNAPRQRQRFERLAVLLERRGLTREQARRELIRLLQGQGSRQLEALEARFGPLD